MAPSWAVRRASVEDAHGIAVVHVTAWQESYSHLAPAETLAALSVSGRADRWTQIIAGDTQVWVAEIGGEIVGWASVNERDASEPADRELEGIYVLERVKGLGVGQALLDSAVGPRPAYLWMAADNPRAAAFYDRNGFVLDGERGTHPLAGVDVDIVRYVRQVPAAT